jgi:TPR repeat protein
MRAPIALALLLLVSAGCKCARTGLEVVDAGPARRVRAVPRPRPCAPLSACVAACERGESGTCYEASRLWVDPVDGGRDLPGAQRLAAHACEKGDGRACVRATALPSPDGGDFDLAAARLLPGQCQAGDLEACELLTTRSLALDAGVEAAAAGAKARALATKACDAGDPFACARAGSALLSGWLGVEDPREGARLLEKACEAGVAGACIELGIALATGRPGLDPDPARSLRLRSAARELSTP